MSNIYMQMKNIEGNVTTANYKGWIELENVEFGIQRELKTRVGMASDRAAITPVFSEVSISKMIDQASNELMLKSCGDKALPEVDIHFCKSDKDSSPFMKIKLSNVMIGRYHTNAAKDTVPYETLTLSFTKIQRTYLGRDGSGSTLSPDVAGYDLEKAQRI
jgi:type VI secretion system secreted protein Hcp